MNNIESMTWIAFKEALIANPNLDLQFQYAKNQRVAASYHITEIKQAPIVSVDCGGVMNSWTEVIVQLWEPTNQQQLKPMKVNKALSIFDLVEKSLALNPIAIVKIEFGNSEFDTRQMFPNSFSINGDDFIVDLRPDATQCKAINRGGSCGTTESGEECCAPSEAEKPKVEMKNLATANSCAPGSGCC
jgi:hypothetical protein